MGEDIQIRLDDESNIFFFLFVILSLISNIIIYSFLKKKYNFKMKVFFYGIGFASCSLLLFIDFRGFLDISLDPYGPDNVIWIPQAAHTLAVLSFTLLYYTYATLLQNENKEISKGTLHLAVLTVISYAALIIFEIIKYQVPVIGTSLLFFGFYFVCCLIFPYVRISLRWVAWFLFLPAYILFLGVILTASLL